MNIKTETHEINIGSGLIGAIIMGWILSWFGFDEVFRHGLKELFDLEVTNSSYYLAFATFGALTTFSRTIVKAGPRRGNHAEHGTTVLKGKQDE
jgi:hypothetical protein